jgi:uncharacterized protein YkwD
MIKKLLTVILIITMVGTSTSLVSITKHDFDIFDVLTMLKHLAGMETLTPTQEELYNFDNKSGVSIMDVLEVLKYIAGMPNAIDGSATNTQMPEDPAKAVVWLLNKEREKENLPALSANISKLHSAATHRADEIISLFSHTRPCGKDPKSVLDEFGVNYQLMGENIAKGYRTSESVVEGWMNSPGHRANILYPSYTHVGVGVVKSSDGTLHWVQLFIQVVR